MRRLVPMLAALALVAGGCSGGDGGEDGDGPLSEADYVERADAICTKYEAQLDELREPQTVADLAPLADQALPIVRRGLRELRALRPPRALDRDVRAWLRLNEQNATRLEALRAAAAAGAEDRVQEIARAAEAAEREADALARELGLEACAAR